VEERVEGGAPCRDDCVALLPLAENVAANKRAIVSVLTGRICLCGR